jgi:hypothetical protein
VPLGDQAPERSSEWFQLRRRRQSEGSNRRAQRLGDRTEGDRRARLDGSTAQHAEGSVGAEPFRLSRQTGLADAGLTQDPDDPASSATSAGDRLVEHGPLASASDEARRENAT